MNLGRWTLKDFVRESNRIENIHREPRSIEIRAHEMVLEKPILDIPVIEAFVDMVQPGAKLRRHVGMNVYVGNHVPPPGGPDIPGRLQNILDMANGVRYDSGEAHRIHCLYETLHPFIDGNGRSGRVLWLWQMGGEAPIGFLHQFYYQTLATLR